MTYMRRHLLPVLLLVCLRLECLRQLVLM